MDLYEISKEKICVEMMIFDLLKALDDNPFGGPRGLDDHPQFSSVGIFQETKKIYITKR